MKKVQSCSKLPKKKQASKQLMSKIYFSRTQQNYLRKYGTDNQYVHELGQLMLKVCKKKLSKAIQQVKSNNNVFRKYLQKKHISKLKIQDVIQFENSLELQAKKIIESNHNIKTQNNLKQLNNDIIRIGFMMILEKLTDQKLNGLISESKYLKETLERENNNLRRLGFDYVGVRHPQKVRNVVEEIKSEEKENGSFKLISSKIRQQTGTIYEVSNFLKTIIDK